MNVFGAFANELSEAHQTEINEDDEEGTFEEAQNTINDVMEKEEQVYVAKFLTSPKLFHLQLADPDFRRQVSDYAGFQT